MSETAHNALFKIAHRRSFFGAVTFAQSLHSPSHVDALVPGCESLRNIDQFSKQIGSVTERPNEIGPRSFP